MGWYDDKTFALSFRLEGAGGPGRGGASEAVELGGLGSLGVGNVSARRKESLSCRMGNSRVGGGVFVAKAPIRRAPRLGARGRGLYPSFRISRGHKNLYHTRAQHPSLALPRSPDPPPHTHTACPRETCLSQSYCTTSSLFATVKGQGRKYRIYCMTICVSYIA